MVRTSAVQTGSCTSFGAISVNRGAAERTMGRWSQLASALGAAGRRTAMSMAEETICMVCLNDEFSCDCDEGCKCGLGCPKCDPFGDYDDD